ncbi:hypothetical protein A1S_3818 [Acinetobacter baumannii ATCC 17978]|nr:hypothetical protein A1S_3818 [Acinetobacter baumannii ATCC 17978]
MVIPKALLGDSALIFNGRSIQYLPFPTQSLPKS